MNQKRFYVFYYNINDHFEKPVSSKTVRKELQKAGFHEKAAFRKSYQNKFL